MSDMRDEISEMLARPYRAIAPYGYDLPLGLVGVWVTCGAGFQLEYDIQTDTGCDALVYWWFYGGRQQFPGVREVIDRTLFSALHLEHLTKMDGRPVLTPFFELLMRHRRDLRESFDPQTPDGATGMWQWWLFAGRAEILGRSAPVAESEIDTLLRSNAGVRTKSAPQLPIPAIIWFIYQLRPDVQAIYDLNTRVGAAGLLIWWFEFGAAEFGELGRRASIQIVDAMHWRHLPEALASGGSITTPLLDAILTTGNSPVGQGRPQSIDQIKALWSWWMSEGLQEVPTMRSGARQGRELARRLDDRGGAMPAELQLGPLALIRMVRDDLSSAFATESPDWRERLLCWWLAQGRSEYPDLRAFADGFLFQALHLAHLSAEQDFSSAATTPLMRIVHGQRQLLSLTALQDAPTDAQLWIWWLNEAQPALFPEPDLSQAQRAALENSEAAGSSAARPSKHLASADIHTDDHLPSKISLVGYPRGEFGLGEDIRLLRASLQTAGIEPTVIRASWKIAARQNIDETSVASEAADYDSDITIYVMPAFDTVTLLNMVGPRAFAAKRRIGFWQWELSHFPPSAILAMELVDEIWCHSEHSAKAFRAATTKPVIKVPLPVFVPEPKQTPRSAWNLPQDAFVVFTSFDGASAIARKHPLGTILAFQQAFPDSSDGARLIVKAMNTGNDSLWRECLRRASVDPRIVILDHVMDRDAYYQLLRNCDAVISLHRAEGFGRLMAEAMALGIPVIASRYSGNVDFMTDANSWLVDGTLIPVMPGDYAFHQDQVWLEPSIPAAADALRNCRGDTKDRSRRAAAGKHDITSNYGLDACGNVYAGLIGAGRI